VHEAVTQTDAADIGTGGVYLRTGGAPGVMAGVLPLREVSRESESEIGETNREGWQAAAAKIPETDSGDGGWTRGPTMDGKGVIADAGAINGGQIRGKCKCNMKKPPDFRAKQAVGGRKGCKAGLKTGPISCPLLTVAGPIFRWYHNK
jgi:hypothetical protein